MNPEISADAINHAIKLAYERDGVNAAAKVCNGLKDDDYARIAAGTARLFQKDGEWDIEYDAEEVDELTALALKYKDTDLESIKMLEDALELAKKLKFKDKIASIDPKHIENVKNAWKTASVDVEVKTTVDICFKIKADGPDPDAVYPHISSPDWMSDWDPYELISFFDDEKQKEDLRNKINKACESVKAHLDLYNSTVRSFEKEHRIPFYKADDEKF